MRQAKQHGYPVAYGDGHELRCRLVKLGAHVVLIIVIVIIILVAVPVTPVTVAVECHKLRILSLRQLAVLPPACGKMTVLCSIAIVKIGVSLCRWRWRGWQFSANWYGYWALLQQH